MIRSTTHTFENVSLKVLGQMSDAAAFSILTYGMNTEAVNGEKGKGNFKPDPGRSVVRSITEGIV